MIPNQMPPMPSVDPSIMPPGQPMMPSDQQFGPPEGMPYGPVETNSEATPEQKQELQKMFEELQSLQGEINSRMFVNKNVADSNKSDLQKQIFQMLQELGVDLNDPNAIRKFLGDLEETNPDMFELLNKLLERIFSDTGEPMPSQLEEGTPPSGQAPEELQNILSQIPGN